MIFGIIINAGREKVDYFHNKKNCEILPAYDIKIRSYTIFEAFVIVTS